MMQNKAGEQSFDPFMFSLMTEQSQVRFAMFGQQVSIDNDQRRVNPNADMYRHHACIMINAFQGWRNESDDVANDDE